MEQATTETRIFWGIMDILYTLIAVLQPTFKLKFYNPFYPTDLQSTETSACSSS